MASVYDELGPPAGPTTPIEESEKARSKKRLTPTQIRAGQVKLHKLVDRAFETLDAAMDLADFPTAVKAAQIVLDRTGFGPKTTVDVNSTHVDLTALTTAQLAEFALHLSNRAKQVGSGQTVAAHRDSVGVGIIESISNSKETVDGNPVSSQHP